MLRRSMSLSDGKPGHTAAVAWGWVDRSTIECKNVLRKTFAGQTAFFSASALSRAASAAVVADGGPQRAGPYTR